jgi:hypothetical protein
MIKALPGLNTAKILLSFCEKCVMPKSILLLALSCTCSFLSAQKVGINKASPTEALDVNGNVNISGALKANGQAGTSGQVLTSTGTGLTWGSLFGYKHCQMFYAAGSASWIVPAGVKEIMVEAWGGGGGYGDYVGGTSGSYARVVQTVSPGSSINYSIGTGGAIKGPGGNTTVTLPEGTLTALGAGPITPSGSYELMGVNNINPAGSMPAFYMPGNRGTTTHYDFGQKSSTVYTQTTYLSSGGAPVGMINASKNDGNIIYYENGVIIWAVLNPGVPTLPSSGGCYYYNAAAGMVIFWW